MEGGPSHDEVVVRCGVCGAALCNLVGDAVSWYSHLESRAAVRARRRKGHRRERGDFQVSTLDIADIAGPRRDSDWERVMAEQPLAVCRKCGQSYRAIDLLQRVVRARKAGHRTAKLQP
jgi:hypothetical protein